MDGLRSCPMGRLLFPLILLINIISDGRASTDVCQPAPDGTSGRPETLCSSPYCTCNNPYGRVHCSCKSNNSTLPQVSYLTIKSTGMCRLPTETRDLEVTDCLNVSIVNKGLEALHTLRTVQITNVKEVTVDHHSFHWNQTATGLSVFITNTTIVNLPSFAFSGYIEKVVFRNVYLGLMKAFAFSSITNTERIQFVNCTFANIEPQSFKKFATNEFQVEKCVFHTIPSRFLHEVHVLKLFRLDSNSIDVVRTLGFQISHPIDTVITQNKIGVVEGEAFSVQVRGSVGIRDNIFETLEPIAFKGITTDRRTRFPLPPEIHFDNNTLGTFTKASIQFNVPEFSVRFSHMRFDDICTCDRLEQWKDLVYPARKNFPTPVEAHLQDLWCHEESNKEKDFDYISGEAYYDEYCSPMVTGWYFMVIVIVSVVAGLCMLIVVAILLLRRRRQWDAVPTSETNGITQKPAKKGLVVPDGRVYRETEFHVVEEKVEPIEEAVPYCVARDRSQTYIREAPR